MAQLEGGAQGTVQQVLDASGAPAVKLTGEIDISNADALGATLERLIGPSPERVVVDLSGLDFMDSAGIAMLLRATARVGTVEIRNPSNVMRRIIECTGLTDVLHLDGQ